MGGVHRRGEPLGGPHRQGVDECFAGGEAPVHGGAGTAGGFSNREIAEKT